jgi:hypothetical protein
MVGDAAAGHAREALESAAVGGLGSSALARLHCRWPARTRRNGPSDVLVCREALTAFEPPKLRGDGLSRFRSPRLRGLCRGRLEVLRERQSGARLGRYRRRFDPCLRRILGSDQKLRVDASAPSRPAQSDIIWLRCNAGRVCRTLFG